MFSKLKLAVILIIEYQELVLIGLKEKNSKKMLSGQWHLPGETVNWFDAFYGLLTCSWGNIFLHAAKRGLQEETGLKVKIKDIKLITAMGVSNQIKKYLRLNVWCQISTNSNKAVANDDLQEIHWVAKNEVINQISLEARNRIPKEIEEYLNWP
ncbi:MAG TPA: NUDIX hydrolase [bacterium]|nr:NUDIX hydrolase [bacterium]HPL95423.1 NUDIX hydrolase [bacterium]